MAVVMAMATVMIFALYPFPIQHSRSHQRQHLHLQ
jgi:hypothetical protein